MRNRILLIIIALVLSSMLITLPASGEAAMDADEALSRMFDTVYLICSDVSDFSTEEFTVELNTADLFSAITLSGNKPDSGSVEFVGGNNELKDLVVWIEDSNALTSLVGIITHKFTVHGEAVFRISAVAGGEVFEKDYTLRIIPYEKNAFSLRTHEILLKPGLPLTAGDIVAQIYSLPPELTGTPVEHFTFTGNGNGRSFSMTEEDIAARIQSEQSEFTGMISFQIANASFMIRNITIRPDEGMIGSADIAGPEPANMTGPADMTGPDLAGMSGPGGTTGPGPGGMPGPGGKAGPGPAGMSGPGNMQGSEEYPPSPEVEEEMDHLFSIPYFAKTDWGTEIGGEGYIIRFSQTELGAPIYLSGELAESGSVTFVSGDDFLQRIIYWHYDHGTPFISLASQLLPTDRPGEAVFHIAAQTGSQSFEKDYTLRIISYPDDAFELTGHEILVSPSDNNTDETIIKKICKFGPVLAESGIQNVFFKRDSDGQETDWMEIISDMQNGRSNETRVSGTLTFDIANARFIISHVTFRLNPYRINGPAWIRPGQETTYTIVPSDNETSLPRDFTLTAVGAELSLDGKLTPHADAKLGDEILLTASSAEADISFTKTVRVSDSPLNALDWTLHEVYGFSVPLLSGKGWNTTPLSEEGSDPVLFRTGSRGNLENSATSVSCEYEISVYPEMNDSETDLENLIKDAEAQLRVFQGPDDLETGMLFINGYPVLYGISASYLPGGGANIRARVSGQIANKYLSFSLMLFGPQAAEDAPVPDVEFLAGFLGRMKIDGQPVTVTSRAVE